MFKITRGTIHFNLYSGRPPGEFENANLFPRHWIMTRGDLHGRKSQEIRSLKQFLKRSRSTQIWTKDSRGHLHQHYIFFLIFQDYCNSCKLGNFPGFVFLHSVHGYRSSWVLSNESGSEQNVTNSSMLSLPHICTVSVMRRNNRNKNNDSRQTW